MNIVQVHANMIELIWDKVVPHLDRVIERAADDLTRDAVKGRLLAGHNLLVAITENDAIIAINILNVDVLDTGKKVLFISITGGDRLDEWMAPFLTEADNIARSLGCFEVRGSAVRKGWLRKVESYNWSESFTVIKHTVGEE